LSLKPAVAGRLFLGAKKTPYTAQRINANKTIPMPMNIFLFIMP